jgi:hypothetical protein
MIYERIENLKPEEFKRLTGVYPETFSLMVKIVSAEKVFHKKLGRPSKLSVEEQILMALSCESSKLLIETDGERGERGKGRGIEGF